MIEFTILLDDSELEFEPFQEEPDLKFMLPPTARIGERDDNVLLDPIPVHCFFNATIFSSWLATRNSLSIADAFSVYLLHDMFKSLLWLRLEGKNRKWLHAGCQDFFDPIKAKIVQANLFDQPNVGYELTARHHYYHRKQHRFMETVDYEVGLEIPSDFQTIGLLLRLQPALSNIFAITYLKKLFIGAYIEALKAEYPSVFAKFKEITYCYQFVEPAHLTGNIQKDVKSLCKQSRVTLKDGRLRIETFIGANSMLLPGEQTTIRLPFWMLLTLQEDPTSVIFPVPKLPTEAPNTVFVDRVRQGFARRVESLLQTVPSRGRGWAAKLADVLAHIDDTIHIESGGFGRVQGAREPMASDAQCALCGSPIPKTFVCLPVQDLGWNPGRYTDWHIGDAGSVCLLCAISHFKVPPEFAMAKKLVWQRQLVYFSISTPHATGESLLDGTPKADLLPFFSAAIKPRLVISSLESLVTLNLVGALFLHSAIKAAEVQRDGEPDLWLEQAIELSPFSFVGKVGKARSKRALPELLRRIRDALGRAVIITDPLMRIRVEVPFHTLACVVGAKSGRHYELKFKPLLVSNEMGTLPVVHDGYHFIDRAAVSAIEEVQRFLGRFRSSKVSDRMKVTAIAADPREFTTIMVESGGFNYETVHERLAELTDEDDVYEYLKRLGTLVMQYPIIRELWR